MKSFEKQLNSEIRRQQLKKVNKTKELVKLLERLLKQDYLFDSEKIEEIKTQLHKAKEQVLEMEKQTSKGFGK